jgi:hypothetical protein
MYFDSADSILTWEQTGKNTLLGRQCFKRLVHTFGKVLRLEKLEGKYPKLKSYSGFTEQLLNSG